MAWLWDAHTVPAPWLCCSEPAPCSLQQLLALLHTSVAPKQKPAAVRCAHCITVPGSEERKEEKGGKQSPRAGMFCFLSEGKLITQVLLQLDITAGHSRGI